MRRPPTDRSPRRKSDPPPAPPARRNAGSPRFRLETQWATAIPDPEWAVYQKAIELLQRRSIRFMLGGGFAQAAFTGRWRNTKDIDLYILPRDREGTIEVLTANGFEDYYDRQAYDRSWIYRSVRSGMIVDVIWAMANQRAQVDEIWHERANRLTIRNERLAVVPVEEFLWCKIYILQRDRCDWIDIMNLLYAAGPRLDWAHLVDRLNGDTPLLRGLLSVYTWLHPERAALLPDSLYRRMELPPPVADPSVDWRQRARYLDSRAWFAALRAKGEKLDI
jgi:hypothetical protein